MINCFLTFFLIKMKKISLFHVTFVSLHFKKLLTLPYVFSEVAVLQFYM